MRQAEIYNLAIWIILAVVLLLYGIVIYFQYKKNKIALFAHQNAIIISPSKIKFLVSCYICFLVVFIPSAVLLWSIKSLEEVLLAYLFFPVLWPISLIRDYPYYSLSIHDGKLEGPPAWSSFWQRIEINLSDIDRDRTIRKNPFRKLGIIVFYSTSGGKILTFGLDDLQVSQVLATGTNINV